MAKQSREREKEKWDCIFGFSWTLIENNFACLFPKAVAEIVSNVGVHVQHQQRSVLHSDNVPTLPFYFHIEILTHSLFIVLASWGYMICRFHNFHSIHCAVATNTTTDTATATLCVGHLTLAFELTTAHEICFRSHCKFKASLSGSSNLQNEIWLRFRFI